jgi:twinkle protein
MISLNQRTDSKSKAVDKEQCPRCAANGGDTSMDNLIIYDDGHKHCFACDLHIRGDDLNGSPTDTKFTYEFLPWRGINADTFRKYGAKTKIGEDGKPLEIGYPERNGSYHIRTLAEKGFYHKGEYKPGCFGMDKFVPGSHKHIVITEGYEDALSLHQVLRVPVVSVHSSSSAVMDCSVDRSALNQYERIYLAFDGDEQGSDAAIAVAKLFDYAKVYHIKFPGGARKDANDFLRNGEGDTLLNLYQNAKKFLPQNIESELRVFKNILFEAPKSGVSYGIPTLDFMTYGIRTGETVLLTAQEGVGKTEVMHKIEYTILKEHPDAAVAAIFLEEPKKRHLQALAGIHLQRPVHLPDCGVDDAEIYQALQEVVRVDDRLHVYSHFGSDDPDHILDTIRFLVSGRGCKYVFLDHITMVVSGLGGDNERRALDYLSTRLEMLVKELDFALILVSHVNDDGYTRGSRNIAKVADIRIDLSRDIKAADPTIRRTTHLMVSKNRFSGRTGPAGQLLFDPITYTLSEELGYGNENVSAASDLRIASMAA